MVGYGWEAISVFVSIICACIAGLTWLGSIFLGWREKAILANHEKVVNEIIDKRLSALNVRIDTIERDIKSNAAANVKMSETFHSHLNKILYTFTGRAG
ncbi:MAG: hypothetical protein V7733_10445 [Paraglaciecola polaris]|uniref:hypothetical protein n=1 Tax=Paraglaciecola polaris TaxID=222814 RepID=UPI0030015AF3